MLHAFQSEILMLFLHFLFLSSCLSLSLSHWLNYVSSPKWRMTTTIKGSRCAFLLSLLFCLLMRIPIDEWVKSAVSCLPSSKSLSCITHSLFTLENSICNIIITWLLFFKLLQLLPLPPFFYCLCPLSLESALKLNFLAFIILCAQRVIPLSKSSHLLAMYTNVLSWRGEKEMSHQGKETSRKLETRGDEEWRGKEELKRVCERELRKLEKKTQEQRRSHDKHLKGVDDDWESLFTLKLTPFGFSFFFLSYQLSYVSHVEREDASSIWWWQEKRIAKSKFKHILQHQEERSEHSKWNRKKGKDIYKRNG